MERRTRTSEKGARTPEKSHGNICRIGDFVDTTQKLLDMVKSLKLENTQLKKMVTEATEIKKRNEILLDMASTLLFWIFDYCNKHDIPIWTEDSLKNIIQTITESLRDEDACSASLLELIKSHKLPLKKFHKRSPEDLPEPINQNDLF